MLSCGQRMHWTNSLTFLLSWVTTLCTSHTCSSFSASFLCVSSSCSSFSRDSCLCSSSSMATGLSGSSRDQRDVMGLRGGLYLPKRINSTAEQHCVMHQTKTEKLGMGQASYVPDYTSAYTYMYFNCIAYTSPHPHGRYYAIQSPYIPSICNALNTVVMGSSPDT